MPARINGIGTTYFGKKDVQVQQGVCESCGRAGPLSSYETRLWFSVLFIPFIPLQKKQIINYCSRCTRHRAMPVEQWQLVQADAIGSAIADVDANPDSPEHAVRCHGTMDACNKREEATKYAYSMAKRFPNNADVLMYLGAWFERIGQSERADKFFDRAIEADPQHPGALRAAAVGLAQQNNPREAEAKLATLRPPSEHFDPALFFAVGQAYQNTGDHAAAVRMFKVVADTTPSAAKEKKFRQAVQRSEAALGQQGSVLAPIPWFRKPAVWWTALAAAAVVAIVAADRYFAAHRELFVVNGLAQPLKVRLDDGDAVQVPPQGRLKLPAAEGRHKMTVVEPAALARDEEFTMKGSILGRWQGNQVSIADPTRSAVISWEESIYAARPRDQGSDFKLHAGEPFAQFDNIDYKFAEFPNQLQVEGGSKTVTKHRVGLVKMTPIELLVNAPDALPGDAKLAFIESHLAADENLDLLLQYYWQVAVEQNQVARCRDYLKKSLSARPVNRDWHRAYQTAAETSGESASLAPDYDAMLAKDPGNADLLYLRGRVEPFGSGSLQFFDAALEKDPHHNFTWAAKAFLLGSTGEFEQALVAIEKAIEADKDRSELKDSRNQILQALGRSDQVAEESRMKTKSDNDGPGWAHYSDLITVLAFQGKLAEAETALTEYSAAIDREWPEDPLQLKLKCRATNLLMAKKYGELQAAIAELKNPLLRSAWNFTMHLCEGKPNDAATDLASAPPASRGFDELSLSIAWRNAHNPAAAQECLKRAISAISSGTAEQKIAAQWLQKPPADLDELLPKLTDLTLAPDDKVIVLLALAEPGRRGREKLIAFAEKLSVWPSARHAFVENSLAAAR